VVRLFFVVFGCGGVGGWGGGLVGKLDCWICWLEKLLKSAYIELQFLFRF